MGGALEGAGKWELIVNQLAELACESAETGYDTYPLKDEMGDLCWHTFHVLREMGVTLPKKFPTELDYNCDSGDDEIDNLWELLERNSYSALILKIYESLNDVWGFYAAYVYELMYDDDLDLINTGAENIEPCLIELAASKIEVEPEFAPKFSEFKHRVRKNYVEWLTVVKEKTFRAGVPLRVELLKMVHGSHDEIGHEAEAESLGLNASRLHPDVYMNELLCGMRAIHQVLLAILKKLGIDKEFKIDESKFYISGAE